MLIDDILDFLFPRYCVMCNKRLTTQEHHLCLPCYLHLPRTLYHTTEHSNLEKLFWGIKDCNVERAVSFFHYNDSNKIILMHLKYHSYPEIGTYMASQFAQEIKSDGSSFFDDIDVIVPIPLHWIRRIKRGYNQSECIAQGISKETHIPVCTKAVKRIVNNKSQTRMQKGERHDNVQNIFRVVHPELLQGKHILIVDDVTTTGSTIESCVKELMKVPDIRISILTLAIAGHDITPPNDEPHLPYISINTDNLRKL